MFTVVKETEKAILFKNGNFVKVLGSGSYFVNKFLGYTIEIFEIEHQFSSAYNLNILLQKEDFRSFVEVVDVLDNEICLHFQDKILKAVLNTGRYVFWKNQMGNLFTKVDLRKSEIDPEVPESLFASPLLTGYFAEYVVYSYQYGLLFINGKFIKVMEAGRYQYWNTKNSIEMYLVDKRQQQIEVLGQELMTEDKISLRLNFISQYKIVDPQKVILEIVNLNEQMHVYLQLVLRDFVASWNLNTLMEKREDFSKTILKKLQERESELGVKFQSGGIKDIILPGEMKDIMNLVTIAERKAQANLITRREETASTRSLLNTAKILDENPTLMKLKEWEYLDKIIEKVGTVNLSSEKSIFTQLSSLISEKK